MTCERVFACIWKVRPLTLATRRTSVATARRSPTVIRLQLWSGAANKDAAASVFQTGSFGFRPDHGGSAGCLRELRRVEVPAHILKTGTALWSGLQSISADAGHELVVSGIPSMAYLRTEHEPGPDFIRPCVESARGGVYL